MTTTTTDVLRAALAEVDAELSKCGYVPGPPRWLHAETITIDREACADAVCERCGRRGMVYLPYHRPDGTGCYHAYACCPRCGDWFAF